MKIKISRSTVFTSTSSFLLLLGGYLLLTKANPRLQFFINTCGEILQDVTKHVHFNPSGVASTLVLLATSISTGLVVRQLIRFLISNKRLQHIETDSRIPNKLRWIMVKHELKKSTVLVANESKLTAFTIGLFKPKIVVSQALIKHLTKQQLEAVMLHELHHLRSRHVLWLLASRLVSSVFFFIPLIEYLARQLRLEFELAADAFVVEQQRTRDHLCDSLALNMQYASTDTPHFATSPIEKRIEFLLDNKMTLEKIGIKSIVVSLFSLTLMFGIAFVQPSSIAANASLEGNVCSDGSECQTTDCSSSERVSLHNFTPSVPASFY